MMIKRFLFLLILLPWLLSSCNFELEGENFVALDRPDTTGISISLTPDTDTLHVFGTATFTYATLTPHQRLISLTATLGNVKVAEIKDPAVTSFSIATRRFDNRIYVLKLTMVVGSGTGSLANQYGNETYKITKEYIVHIDNSSPPDTEFDVIRVVDGTVEVSWKKYNGVGFQQYLLQRMTTFNGSSASVEIRGTGEINELFYRDSTFIGGDVTYRLTITAKNYYSPGITKTFTAPYDLQLKAEKLDESNVKFTWRKTPLFKNFLYYKLAFDPRDDTRTFEIRNVNDTTLTIDAQLSPGMQKRAIIYAYPKETFVPVDFSIHSDYLNVPQ